MNTHPKPSPDSSFQNKLKRFLSSPWIFLVLLAVLMLMVNLFAMPNVNISQEISYS